MRGFVQGAARQQTTLLPECLDDGVDESNSIRAVDVFVDALELRDLGFDGVDPAATGRPAYHPSPMLKLYIYGYLNRVQSSRRLARTQSLPRTSSRLAMTSSTRSPIRPLSSPQRSTKLGSVQACARQVRCTFDIVAKVENRATRKISRKLIFGLLCRCVAFQRHYRGP